MKQAIPQVKKTCFFKSSTIKKGITCENSKVYTFRKYF